MKNKKTMILLSAAVALCVCLAVFCLLPVPLMKNTAEVTISDINYRGQDEMDRADLTAIAAILVRYSHNRIPDISRKYDPQTLILEIGGVTGRKTFQILLGEQFFIYNDGEHAYTVCRGEKLTAELEAYFQYSG